MDPLKQRKLPPVIWQHVHALNEKRHSGNQLIRLPSELNFALKRLVVKSSALFANRLWVIRRTVLPYVKCFPATLGGERWAPVQTVLQQRLTVEERWLISCEAQVLFTGIPPYSCRGKLLWSVRDHQHRRLPTTDGPWRYRRYRFPRNCESSVSFLKRSATTALWPSGNIWLPDGRYACTFIRIQLVYEQTQKTKPKNC